MKSINDKLSLRQQKIIAISAFTAKGDVENMKMAFNESFDAGLTINEINEELAHLYAYCGFAASVRGTNMLQALVVEREDKGLITEKGREASPLTDTKSKYARGEAAQEIVTGMNAEQLKIAFSFNPVLDIFLKEHLFADIFGSDLLDFKERELTTVAALVSMGEPLVRPHFGGALNVGISENQVWELLAIIENIIGVNEADNGREIFEQVLKDRKGV